MDRRIFIKQSSVLGAALMSLGSLAFTWEQGLVFPNDFSEEERKHLQHLHREMMRGVKEHRRHRRQFARLLSPVQVLERKVLPCGGYETHFRSRSGQLLTIQQVEGMRKSRFYS